MQPFPVTCETCRARLKIRDASVIGEIHACPRCGGMVHILPPAGWTAESPAESAPSAPAAITPLSAPSKPVVTASTSLGDTWVPTGPPADFNVDEALAAPSTISTPTATEHRADAALADQPASNVAVAPAATPITESFSPSLVQRALAEPILLWGTSAAVVLFAGGLSIALWLTSEGTPLSPPTPSIAAAPAPPIAPSDQVSRQTERSGSSEKQIASNGNDSASAAPHAESTAATSSSAPSEHQVARPVVEEQQNVAPQPESITESIADQLPELPPAEPAPSPIATNTPAPNQEPSIVPSEPAADTPAKPVLKFDPLNFDPLALGLSSGPAVAPDATRTSVADSANLDPLPPPSADNERLPSDNELFQPEADLTITIQRGPAPAANVPAADVGQQLALPIDAIDMPAVSLVSFVNSVAELADVPITLDPQALQMAGVSPRADIVVRARNTTLEKLLRDTLKNERLDFIARDGRIVVVRPNIDTRRSVNYELKDLVPVGSADAADFAELLQRFVAPLTWQAAGGENTVKVAGTKLIVDQTHGVHYQILIFFERLRHARDLAPRSQYPVKLLSINSPYAKLYETLDETTTFTFLPWTPLAEVVTHCEDATKLTILVDWAALAEVGLSPSSPLSCSTIDRKWDDALTAILAELGLAWTAVDSQTIQITSKEAAERAQQLEFYALAKEFHDQFSSPDALVDALDTELQEKFPPRIGSAPAQLAIDAPSRRLIVLASAPAHRYLTQRLSGVVTDHVAATKAPTESARVSAQPLP